MALQLQAILELARRLTLPDMSEKYVIYTPADAAQLVIPEMRNLDHEEIIVLVLDTKNRVVAKQRLYIGTVNSATLRAAEIFRLAITRNCPGIIFCHYDPSGSLEPSPEDVQVTDMLVAAAKHLDIDFVDHLIIGGNSFMILQERLRWRERVYTEFVGSRKTNRSEEFKSYSTKIKCDSSYFHPLLLLKLWQSCT